MTDFSGKETEALNGGKRRLFSVLGDQASRWTTATIQLVAVPWAECWSEVINHIRPGPSRSAVNCIKCLHGIKCWVEKSEGVARRRGYTKPVSWPASVTPCSGKRGKGTSIAGCKNRMKKHFWCHQAAVADVVRVLAHGKSLMSSNSLWLLFLLCHAQGWNVNRDLWVTTEGVVWSWNLGVQG